MSEETTDNLSTRERILDAAMNIFSAKGFHDTKLDEIVTEASISKGSIYFHFPNIRRSSLSPWSINSPM